MPTKKDMALEMLENWRPWKEITKKLGYGGGTYEGLRIFLDSTGKTTYEDLRKTKQIVNELVSDEELLQSRIQEHNHEIATQENELTKMKRKHSELKSRNRELSSENHSLEKRNLELLNRGVDDEAVKMILSFDHKNRAELILRVQTLNKFTKLEDEIEEQKAKLNTLSSQIKNRETEKARLMGEIDKLDNEKKQLQTSLDGLSDLAEISEQVITYGYSPTVFENLLKTIQNYLGKTPYETSRNVFNVIQEYLTLQKLRDETTKAQNKLESVKNELVKTRGILEALEEEILGKISLASDKSIALMDAHKASANQQLHDLHDQQETIIKDSQERLQIIWDELVEKQNTWEIKLKEIGSYEVQLRTALALTTLYQNPEAVKDLSIQEIWQLIYIIDRWAQYHLKGVKASPSQEIAPIESGLNSYSSYSIPVITAFLYEEIYKRAKP
jgi:chromosome segregation ATPase